MNTGLLTLQDNFVLPWEYEAAVWSGQLLSVISSSFATYIPDPAKPYPFRFEIEVDNLKLLSSVLATIIKGYANDNDMASVGFSMKASEYFFACWYGQQASPTWGLIHIAVQILEHL